MLVTAETAAVAEDLYPAIRWMPGMERVHMPGCVVSLLPGDDPLMARVGRVRLEAGEVKTAVGDVRARLGAAGRTASTWWLGPSSTPSDIEPRLRAMGMKTAHPMTAMAIAEPPPEGPADVEVRPGATPADAAAVATILAVSFDLSDHARRGLEASVLEEFASREAADAITDFLAFVNGEPVATAASVYLDRVVGLTGGSTLPAFRGRGPTARSSTLAGKTRSAAATERSSPRPSTPPAAIRGGDGSPASLCHLTRAGRYARIGS